MLPIILRNFLKEINMKATNKNIIVYIFLKYILFYVFIMFKNKNYALLEVLKIRSFQDLIYYCIMFLLMPVLFCILFLAPLKYSLKVKSRLYFLLIITSVFALEYFLYTYLASTSNLWNGLINIIIGLSLFILMFYQQIWKK